MCSIFSYVSQKVTKDIWTKLKTGLTALEYKGHDLTGLAIFDKNSNRVNILKGLGTVQDLEKSLDLSKNPLQGNIGIGYVTWTNEESLDEYSSHSDDYLVTGIFSGNVNNFLDIKDRLIAHGYAFYSKSNNEILVNLIDYFYKKEMISNKLRKK